MNKMKQKTKAYMKPSIEVVPFKESLMQTILPGSNSTPEAFGKEHDFGGDYSDFLSSFERGKEIEPLKDE